MATRIYSVNFEKHADNRKEHETMLIKKTIYELYRTNYGLDVILKQNVDDTFSVSSLDHLRKVGTHHGVYATRRGAMIAIGKRFGKGQYRFKSMWSE